MNTKTISSTLNTLLRIIAYILWIIGGISIMTANSVNWSVYGDDMGRIAIILLWIALVPGLLGRFKVQGHLKSIQTVLFQNRRWIGINMFSFALLHAMWSRWFTYAKFGFPRPDTIPVFETFGVITLYLLFPLFVTSNNQSVRFLKKWWKRVHYLIYIAMGTAAAHVSLQGTEQFILFGVPSILIVTMIVVSYISVFYNKKYVSN